MLLLQNRRRQRTMWCRPRRFVITRFSLVMSRISGSPSSPRSVFMIKRGWRLLLMLGWVVLTFKIGWKRRRGRTFVGLSVRVTGRTRRKRWREKRWGRSSRFRKPLDVTFLVIQNWRRAFTGRREPCFPTLMVSVKLVPLGQRRR